MVDGALIDEESKLPGHIIKLVSILWWAYAYLSVGCFWFSPSKTVGPLFVQFVISVNYEHVSLDQITYKFLSTLSLHIFTVSIHLTSHLGFVAQAYLEIRGPFDKIMFARHFLGDHLSLLGQLFVGFIAIALRKKRNSGGLKKKRWFSMVFQS